MKNFLWLLVIFSLFSCKKEQREYDVDVSDINIQLEIFDINKDFYNTNVPLSEFKAKYPFYLDTEVPDETYELQRKDSVDLEVYAEIQKKINLQDVENELIQLFKYIKYYYPTFSKPKVYFFSSLFDENAKLEPVQYNQENNSFAIALDMFLGEDDPLYSKYTKFENYFLQSMNPQNICPKVSYNVAKYLPLMDINNNQFLNFMEYEGKVLLLQDAFLPSYPDELKIDYTKEQLDWCYENEKNIWEYFIREDYLFSDDLDLRRRFIQKEAFSKFYTFDESGKSVDVKSPGGVGKWVGWQIIRSYMNHNPKVKITDLMVNTNFKQIFEESDYQP